MAQIRVHCRVCNKPVEIDVLEDEFGQDRDGILRIMFAHGDPIHALVVYVDRQLRVRAIESPDKFQMDSEQTTAVISSDGFSETLSEQLGEPCYQAVCSFEEVKMREKTAFVLDKAVLRIICESGTICLSEIRRGVSDIEMALGEKINLKQIEDICERYVREGLIRRA